MNSPLSLGIAIFAAGSALALGSTPCYFIQRDGCGSGSTFCTNGLTVCDVGYSTRLDTGCGKLGPFEVTPVSRWCYILSNTITHPCDQAPIGGGYTQIGCAQNGICCYGTLSQTPELSIGDMTEPAGAECCSIKAES